MRKHFGWIETLKENEVFVFGSNEGGFHGAGSAGKALRNDEKNRWRSDPWFAKAMRKDATEEERKGHWAVFGIGRGHQVGKNGESYAIATVTRPGARRSISLDEILKQLKELGEFARRNPEKTIFCCIVGGGYNGYSRTEIGGVYKKWVDEDCPPFNIWFPEEVGRYLERA